MKTTTKTGMKVRSNVKAGGFSGNHIRSGLKVRTPIKAGGFSGNHTRLGLKVQTAIRGGYSWSRNHNARLCVA